MSSIDNILVVNARITPDGTRIQSKHRHDYVTHLDKNGYTYMVDGGIGSFYVKYNVVKEAPDTPAYLYFRDPIEEIRKYHCRGGRGKDGKQELTWTPLCEMSNEWLKNCITYDNVSLGTWYIKLYLRELQYRKHNGIFIKD